LPPGNPIRFNPELVPLVTGQIRVRQRDFDQAVVSGIQEKEHGELDGHKGGWRWKGGGIVS